MSVMQEISSNVRNMKLLEYTILARRANQITKELRQGVRKPYKEVIDVSWGDPHRAGVKPLSFVRQVFAACIHPQLMDSDKLPVDVRERAQRLLKGCSGESIGWCGLEDQDITASVPCPKGLSDGKPLYLTVGQPVQKVTEAIISLQNQTRLNSQNNNFTSQNVSSYTATSGISEIVQRISEFITRRDGGAPSYPENIYISPGSQWALMNILNVLVNHEASPRTGVLNPLPSYYTSTLSMKELGAVLVPYNLNEEQGWELQVAELHRALESAKGVCNPVALYVINPGNPTGHVQSRKSIQEVIRFVSEKRLFLLADEVYQDCVYGEKSEFVSYKRVLSEMGPPFSDTVQLASFHSASKGIMGECGLRGGYVELVNLDPAVMKYIYKLFSIDSCAPVLGQFALDLMMNPPQPGDPSYPLYCEETQHIRKTLVKNVKRVVEVVNSLPGFCCQPVEGGAFAFPRLHLPPKAIRKAKELGMQPDVFYCNGLLEEAGVLVDPGFKYGPKEGTHHIRFCIMTPEDTMEDLLMRLSSFHTQFMKDFS